MPTGKRTSKSPLDAIDRKIVAALQRAGRASNVELANTIHLSAPQAFRRTRALEERGVITGYAARVDPQALGYDVVAYVAVSIAGDQFSRVREIERELAAYAQVLECHAVSGDHDYLLKVVAHDLKDLSQLLTDRMMQIAGVDDVRSMIALEEIKPPSPVPVE
jgi:DNA-binding Lrp family transcriptional regulator